MKIIHSKSLRRPISQLITFTCTAILLLSLVSPLRAQTIAPQRLTVDGSPEEIGSAIGRSYGQVIRALAPGFINEGMRQTQLSRAGLDARCADLAGHLAPDDVAELHALASAAGISYRNALVLNFFYSLTQQETGCRQLALWGSHTTDGHLLHARNLDWVDYPGHPLNNHHLFLECHPAGATPYLSFTWPGLVGVLTGTNRKGLTVGFNTLAPSNSPPRSSEPTFFTLARVLRSCATIDEAVACIRQAAPLDNGSVMISSLRDNRAVVVEIIDGQIGVREGSDGVIGNANYPTREAGLTDARNPGPAATPACLLARSLGGTFDLRRMTTIMSDKQVLSPVNLLSVVIDPAHNLMLVSCGHVPAGTGPYEAMPIFTEHR